MDTAIQPSPATEPQRHILTGDVHLMLRRGNDLLFGQRQHTGFEGIWTDRSKIVSELGRYVSDNVSQEGIKLHSGTEVLA